MLPQDHISNNTRAGANLVADGATFRVWAPNAEEVYLHGTFGNKVYDQNTKDRLLHKNAGYWTGFQQGARDGDHYRFWVVGTGSSGYKRDPYARELAPKSAFPNCFSVLRASDAYPWHDAGFRTPEFSDMIVYQIHIGTYAVQKPGVASNFLDVCGKLPHLAKLGINLLQPLPVDEQENNPSMGYGGADLFAPDFPYVADVQDLPKHLGTLNKLLSDKGQGPLLKLDDIQSAPGQLKALVDLCHVYGIGVVFDVVYNHAGGFDVGGKFDDNCIYYFDRVANRGNNNDSLYFTDKDRGTGGLAFATWNADVRQFLFDNAHFFVDEYHVDGFRYDEVSTLLSTNQANGWDFCRELTTGLRRRQPRLLQNAEFWPGRFNDIPGSAQPIVTAADRGGAGFDVVQHDGLRGAVRSAIASASWGASAFVSMNAIASALYPAGFDHAWRAVTCLENHDLVLAGREQRVPTVADPSNRRSWYARSRTRCATAILMTAPGIPQLFMGQEFLEDKQWDAAPNSANLLWWDGLKDGADSAMSDHFKFTQDLIWLRRAHQAARGDNVNAFYVSDADRVLAFHRWIEGLGGDLIVVASLAETTRQGYRLGFPAAGFWREIFNSDAYDHFPNPWIAGNRGRITAEATPMHGFTASAALVLPANSVVVFARD
jgi:1,4-alpha-glucan branching enzyme